ncbi:MAG: hypothetical protein WC584_00630 [Candidatus Pacearchaeota archaeon]
MKKVKKSQITIFVIIAILVVSAIFIAYFFFIKSSPSENNIPDFNDSQNINSEADCIGIGGVVRTAQDFKTTSCLAGETDLGFITNLKCACHCCKSQE